MTAPRVLVAGIGNIFMSDDAFGSEVARQLLAEAWPDGVTVADYGIRGVHLSRSRCWRASTCRCWSTRCPTARRRAPWS